MPISVWLSLIVIAVAALCAVAYVALASEQAIIRAKLEAHEVATLSAVSDLVGDTLQAVNRDLLFLASESLLKQSLNNDNPATLQTLTEHWLRFSQSRGIYDKVRWLDEHGKERIRINYNNGTPVAVAADKLQSRALRYFFKDAFALNDHEIYVSPFDLNIEGEMIELPYKPTIRTGVPLFNAAGERRGVLLLNYLGVDIFNRIVQAASDVAPHLWLVNADGYWLRSPTPSDEWGFMFERPDLSMSSRYPAAWANITAQRSGQFVSDEGLWTFDTIYPVLEGQSSSSGSGQIFSPSTNHAAASQYFWKAITLVSRSRYESQASAVAQNNGLARLGQNLIKLLGKQSSSANAHRSNDQERLAAQVFMHTKEAVMITDQRTRIIMTNAAFSQITGYAQAEAMGRMPTFLQSRQHDADNYKMLWAKVLMEGEWQGEVWNRRKNGEIFAAWLSVSTVRNADNEPTHYISVFSDITQIKQSAERMEYFAHHDALTGLPNRRLLTARLEHSMQLAQREGRQFALFFIDLDHFKSVNDQLGHEAGDDLLKEVSQRLGGILRAEDTLARLGGDEFVILLENVGGEHHVTRVSDSILSKFPCRVPTPTGSIDVTVSIGISFYPRDGDTPATLLGSADHAMYQAKQGGRNAAAHASAAGDTPVEKS